MKKKHACLHPEGDADAKDGNEHDQWDEASRWGTISFIGDCEHYQQEDEGAEELVLSARPTCRTLTGHSPRRRSSLPQAGNQATECMRSVTRRLRETNRISSKQ